MRRWIALLCVMVLAGGGMALALADGEWTGEVLDLGCYEKNGSHGDGHAGCAVKCLNGGAAMGLLVDGEVVKVDTKGSEEAAIKTLQGLGGKSATVKGSSSMMDDETWVKVTSAMAAM